MQRIPLIWPNYRDVKLGDRVIVQPLVNCPLPEGLHPGDSVIVVEFRQGLSVVSPVEDDGTRWVVRDECVSPSTDLWIGGVPERRPDGMTLWTGDAAVTCRAKHDVAQLPDELSPGTVVELVEYAYGFWVVRPEGETGNRRRWVVYVGCLRPLVPEPAS
jgi:hypothetical protein